MISVFVLRNQTCFLHHQHPALKRGVRVLSLLALLLCSLPATASITISNSSMSSSGQVAVAYSGSVTATGSCVPYTWTVSGALPPGLQVSRPAQTVTQTLTVAGKPTASGTFIFTIAVTGCHHRRVASRSFTVQIVPAPPPPTAHLVTLNWTAPTTPYVYFSVYRGTQNGGPYTRLASNIAAPPFDDSQVTSGATYFYVVTDTDNTGAESLYSNQAQAVIPTP